MLLLINRIVQSLLSLRRSVLVFVFLLRMNGFIITPHGIVLNQWNLIAWIDASVCVPLVFKHFAEYLRTEVIVFKVLCVCVCVWYPVMDWYTCSPDLLQLYE